VLEERVAGQTTAHYVWSPVYVDAVVLRDRYSGGTLTDRRRSRRDVQRLGIRPRQPPAQRLRDKLGPVVAPQVPRHATHHEQLRQLCWSNETCTHVCSAVFVGRSTAFPRKRD
jgi:hypothetical protein